MNQEPQQFEFQFQTNTLRVIADEHGNPWFCAKDVCDVLGYANHNETIKYHCRPDGVANCYPILDRLGRQQYPIFIDEGNLYRLMIKSNKPEAKPFEAQVCDEILPTIRKHGAYVRPNLGFADNVPEGTPANLPPFQRINSALLVRLSKKSKALEDAYMVECGITPDYVAQLLSQVDKSPVLGITQQDQPTNPLHLALDFVLDWRYGKELFAPYIPCLGGQALKLFKHWLRQRGLNQKHKSEALMDALVSVPGFRLGRNPDQPARGPFRNAKQSILQPWDCMPHQFDKTAGLSFENSYRNYIQTHIAAMDAALVRLGVG